MDESFLDDALIDPSLSQEKGTGPDLFWHGKSDSEWEYEYDGNDVEEFYFTLDLSTHDPDGFRRRTGEGGGARLKKHTKRGRKKTKTKKSSAAALNNDLDPSLDPSADGQAPTTDVDMSLENDNADATELPPTDVLPDVIAESIPPQREKPSDQNNITLANLHTHHPLVEYKGQLYTSYLSRPLGTDVYILPKNPDLPSTQHAHLQPLDSAEKYSLLATSRTRLVGIPIAASKRELARRHRNSLYLARENEKRGTKLSRRQREALRRHERGDAPSMKRFLARVKAVRDGQPPRAAEGVWVRREKDDGLEARASVGAEVELGEERMHGSHDEEGGEHEGESEEEDGSGSGSGSGSDSGSDSGAGSDGEGESDDNSDSHSRPSGSSDGSPDSTALDSDGNSYNSDIHEEPPARISRREEPYDEFEDYGNSEDDDSAREDDGGADEDDDDDDDDNDEEDEDEEDYDSDNAPLTTTPLLRASIPTTSKADPSTSTSTVPTTAKRKVRFAPTPSVSSPRPASFDPDLDPDPSPGPDPSRRRGATGPRDSFNPGPESSTANARLQSLKVDKQGSEKAADAGHEADATDTDDTGLAGSGGNGNANSHAPRFLV